MTLSQQPAPIWKKTMFTALSVLLVAAVTGCSGAKKQAGSSPSPTASSSPSSAPSPSASPSAKPPANDPNWVNTALTAALDKVHHNVARIGGNLPVETKNGQYTFAADGGWTGSFWTGLLWLAYEHDPSADWAKQTAELAEKRLDTRILTQQSTLDHDVGFLSTLSSKANYMLTGNKDAYNVATAGSKFLFERYNPVGKFIPAWNKRNGASPQEAEERKGEIIVDTMMNLPLLFWGSKETNHPDWKQAAMGHADTAMKYLIRDDGSAFHAYLFNPTTGAPIRGKTEQGYSDSSAWSRGQSWLIYGYTIAYRYTGDQKYLDTARKVTDYYLDHLPADGIPYWDFKLPNNNGAPKDTSSAAIAASGLIDLAKEDPDSTRKMRYQKAAESLLQKLHQGYEAGSSDEGILTQGCANKPHNDCGNSLIYGDYFYVEALMKLTEGDKFKEFW